MPTNTAYPTSSSGWTNSNFANSPDGAFATDLCGSVFNSGDNAWEPFPTANLSCGAFSGLNAGMGAGDTINGIEIDVNCYSTGGTQITGYCYLTKSGVPVGNLQQFTMSIGSTTVVFGGPADSLGATFNGGDIANLGVVFYAFTTGHGTFTVGVDFIRVSATYSGSTPNAFVWTDLGGAAQSTYYNSNTITVSGLGVGVSVPVTVSGAGLYQKNSSGVWTTSPGTAQNGDTFVLTAQSAAAPSTAVNTTLTIGGVSDTYTITTGASDTTPDAFSFPPAGGCELNTVNASAPVTITGINAPASISVSGASGQYRINGGAWTASAGSITNGSYVEVFGTSSGSYSTVTTVTLTVGGVGGNFNIQTRAADTTPNAFSFTDVTGATTSTLYTSNLVTITGIEAAANVSFSTSGGTTHEYQKNGGAWTAVGATTVNNNDTMKVRMISPAGVNQAGNITMNVGGVSDTYTVATGADTTPNQFTFTDNPGAPGGFVVLSNIITLSGMTAAVPVLATAVGGRIKINGAASVVSGSVVNGDTIQAEAITSQIPLAVVNVLVTVETIFDTFSVTTRPITMLDF